MAVARVPDWRLVAGAFDGGAGSATGKPIEEVPVGALNGVNTTFALSHIPLAGYPILLFLNGVYQNRFTVEYSTLGASITYAVAPKAADSHVIVYWVGAAGTTGVLRARSFASGTDVVNYGTNAAVYNLQDMSLGIWIKLPSSASGSIIIYGYDGSNASADNTAFGLAVSGAAGSWNIFYGHDYGSGGATDQDHEFVTGIPNDKWVYVGFTRDTTAKTVTLYLGDGVSVTLVQVFTYTQNHDGGTSTNLQMQVGNCPGSHPGGSKFTPLVGSAQQHYISSAKWALSDHQAAMNGSPPSAGLVLSCAMGNTPEQDTSATAASGTVTGTTLVQGH